MAIDWDAEFKAPDWQYLDDCMCDTCQEYRIRVLHIPNPVKYR